MKKSEVKRIADVEAKKAVSGHVKSMHDVKKMAKGGKTNENMRKYGRGMAKVINQRTPSRGG